MDKKKIHVAIVGAGLSGLTTAFYLKRAGISFRVFEKADRPGGVIQTHREQGFVYEFGPNTGVLSRPEVAGLLEELKDECTLEVADEAAKSRWIWKKDRWEPLPSGLIGGVTTSLFSFPDKLRLLGEPFRAKGKDPNETLARLVLRRMGRSFLDYAIDPFILGIYSGDPARLVTRYAFPKLYWLEQDYGSFIKGAMKKAREPKTEWDKKATKEIFSVEGGLSNLTEALVKYVGHEHIRLGCSGLAFRKHDEGYGVNVSDGIFSHVVSATGGYALEGLFPFIPRGELNKILQMDYSKVVQVSVGFRNWQGIPLRAFGGLVPSVEQRRILGVLFLSSFLKNRAPEGGALLSVFLGGVRKPGMIDLTDDELIRITGEELTGMLKLQEFNPDLIRVFRYRHAIPQYGIESEEKLKAIDKLERKFPGLVLAGNIRDGIGIADRIKQGKEVASQILSSL
jgi:protoporphyrinogen/coproporphyrinogen III oxidase